MTPSSNPPDTTGDHLAEIVAELRRNRNTGPTVHQRAPRVLGPRAQTGRRW